MEVKNRKLESQEFLGDAEYESLPCNLCTGEDFDVVAVTDCLGLPSRTCFCRRCGMVFINPRLTKPWYEKYYAYMDKIRRAYKHGGENPKEKPGVGFEDARRHGRALAERLKPFIKPGLTIDVGSAEGGMLFGMKELLPIQPLGIEPTISRAEFAKSKGILTYPVLIENIKEAAPDLPLAANIICTKSLNHFLDPRFFFQWSYRTLGTDGRLVLEVKNFRQQCRMSGRLRLGVQIDHPFMFTPETLTEFVRAAGFEIIYLDIDEFKSPAERRRQREAGLPVGHMRLAARKTAREPFARDVKPHPRVVSQIRRELSPLNLYLNYLVKYSQPVKNALARLRALV